MATGRKFFKEKTHGEGLANLFLNFGDGVKAKKEADEILKSEGGRQEFEFAKLCLANKLKSTDGEIFAKQNILLAAAITHAKNSIQINEIAELLSKIRTNDNKGSAELTMQTFLNDHAGDNKVNVLNEAKALDALYRARVKCVAAAENLKLHLVNHDAPVNNNAMAASPQTETSNNNNAPVAETPRPPM
jgi:hypothetical protein